MLIAALLAVQAVVPLPEITVRRNANGFRADAATFEFWQSTAVYAEIKRRAADLCSGKQVKWGKFASLELGKNPGEVPPTISGYFQEFSCTNIEKPSYAPAPANWKAAPRDDADARQFFESYYAKRDSGEFAAARAMFQQGVLGEERSIEQLREFNRKLGSGRRRITGVTWYVNPPSAPHPGVYVALDFVGDYPALHVYCGYIVLFRKGPGSYEITREEQNLFARGDGSADPSQISIMRAASCRGS